MAPPPLGLEEAAVARNGFPRPAARLVGGSFPGTLIVDPCIDVLFFVQLTGQPYQNLWKPKLRLQRAVLSG